MLNVAVLGLGVGYALSCAIAETGHNVVGIDTNPEVVKNPRADKSVDFLLGKTRERIGKNLKLTSAVEAIQGSDLVVICVGTGDERTLILGHVEEAIRQCLRLLTKCGRSSTILVYSTLPYGSSKRIQELFVEEKVHLDEQVHYCYMPLMIAQGTTANDFVNPPFIAFGAYSQEAGNVMRDFYLDFIKRSVLFNGKVPPNFVTTPEIAELAKLVANAFLSTKISFANMISQFCEANAIDGQMLLRIVGSDWRIGSAMLKPGYSFGGACFPRDLESLILSFQRARVDYPILDATRGVNFQRVLDPVRIIETHKLGKRILVLGVAYKAGLKDTRGSASLSLVSALRERGYQVTSFDPNIDTASFDSVMSNTADVAIVTTPEQIFKSVGRWCRVAKIQAILDYANIVEDTVSETTRLYKAGLGWVN